MALRTALYDAHAALGATFVEFAGYDMPVHYGSIKEEHAAVRTTAGIFDVSHMSNLWVTGPKAAAAVSRVCPFDAAALVPGKGKYSAFLRGDGTILDDTIVFRAPEDWQGQGPRDEPRFYIIPNAGRNEAAAEHLRHHMPGASVVDETPQWSILALQGPKARAILAEASPDTPPKFHCIATMRIAGVPVLVSGTGYTGEKGVEIYIPVAESRKVWDHLMTLGAPHGLRPIGLGARDTLRLEKGYCLAGNEFEGGRTPLEAGLDFIVDWNIDFLGRDALRRQQESGAYDRLVGIRQEKGIPRHGYAIAKDGATIGKVTSGTLSPTLETGIALGYARGVNVGDAVDIDIRGKPFAATVVKPPFV